MATSARASHDEAARREELLDAAVAVLRRDGPDAPMTALAARAGITKPILYRHFGDKAGLLDAWAARTAAELGRRITDELARERRPRSRIRSVLLAHLRALGDDPHGMQLLAGGHAPGAGAARRSVSDLVVRAVAEALTDELSAAGAATDAATTWARALVGMARQVGDAWLVERDVPVEELADRLTDLVWLGLRGVGGPPGPGS